MHPQHPKPVLARGRIGAKAHQGRGNRDACRIHQLTQQLAGAGA
eukprot:CAMPEP_0195278730 /NCGR_PEP_ID=MMETSP0706-20130129/20000_1 /TAXON_ID=33640 /ORGANISM="Asterionellopsis glacialis, Strain CCMP134" /LENGTH=43 /DNA_ID= /DNA_START= /DNA_END= /DNA_ORIENTATION=